VQLDPVKPTLKAPGIKRLKLECDELVSTCAFKFKLRRYNKVNQFYTAPTAVRALMKSGDSYVTKHDRSSLRILGSVGRGLHSSTFQLNLSRS